LLFSKDVAGVSLEHGEAMNLIKQIAVLMPDVISNAKEISFQCKDTPNCRMLIKTTMDDTQITSLRYLASVKNLTVSKDSEETWSIY